MNGDGVKLLLVDDETGFTEVLAKRLSRRGFRVATAASGEQAVPMLRDARFDVAVLDLKLDGMDGEEILKIFRLMAPEMPALMLTGHGSQSSLEACMKLGAADYLSKPVDLEQLIEKINQIAGGGPQ